MFVGLLYVGIVKIFETARKKDTVEYAQFHLNYISRSLKLLPYLFEMLGLFSLLTLMFQMGI